MRVRAESSNPVKKRTAVLCAFCFEDNTTPVEKGLLATIQYYSQLPSQRRQKILEFYENK